MMVWNPSSITQALSQGMLGRHAATFSPSLLALGGNRYLGRSDFFKMLGFAFALHLAVFVVAELLPDEKVEKIPVRALSFKLGDADRVAAYAPTPLVAAPPAAPVMQAQSAESWQAAPNTPSPAIPAPLKPIAKPLPKQAKPKKPDREKQVMPQIERPAPPAPNTPQRYVREVGAPTPQAVAAANAYAGSPSGAIGGQGSQTSVSEQTSQAVRARYEQQISSWIQKHKLYPRAANGREGRAVVRVRIDRSGAVRYYAIEQGSGLEVLDTAALDMIRRANPVPAVPENYPSGNLIEFLIPIAFKAPQ